MTLTQIFRRFKTSKSTAIEYGISSQAVLDVISTIRWTSAKYSKLSPPAALGATSSPLDACLVAESDVL